MIDSQVIAFFFVASVLAITPGADTMLVMKNSMRFGSAAGWATTIGILGGTLVHALISALGISVILTQSEALFQLVKALGALYLVWLGIQALSSAGQRPQDDQTGKNLAVRGAFLEGLITNILNPKVAIFYIAFLPQFIDASDPVLAKSLLLASIHNGLSLLWLGALVAIIARGSTWIQRPHIQKRLSRISGAILIALGLRLALESR
jgi:RhtB (resistance to homoserine/threonine) family protein